MQRVWVFDFLQTNKLDTISLVNIDLVVILSLVEIPDEYLVCESSTFTEDVSVLKHAWKYSAGRVEIVKFLDKRKLLFDKLFLLNCASSEGWIEIVKWLLHYYPESCNIYQGIEEASKNGHVEIVKLLLNYVHDVCLDAVSSFSRALSEASIMGNVEIVKLLLEVCKTYEKYLVDTTLRCTRNEEIVNIITNARGIKLITPGLND